MTEKSFAPPELGNLKNYFVSGIRFVLLKMIVFSPSIAVSSLAVIFMLPVFLNRNFSDVTPGFLVYHVFLALFLAAGAAISFVLLLLIFPVCFFRFAEGDEFLWAVQVKGILEDLNEMGFVYWEKFFANLILTAACFVIIIFVYVFVKLMGFRYFIPEIAAGYLACFFFLLFIFLLIRSIGDLYSELHYHYK